VEAFKIVGFAVLTAIAYGIAHDLVTAHLCVEYFSIAHPQVIADETPLRLALVWGVLATWWMGLFFGLLLAFVARSGRGQKTGLKQLFRPVLAVAAVSLMAALSAGLAGWLLYGLGIVGVPGGWASALAPEIHRSFTAVAYAHYASYLAAMIGAIIVICQTWRRRKARLAGA